MPSEAPLKIKDIVDKTTLFFKQKDFASPRLDAELLISDILKLKRIDLYLKYDQPLSEQEVRLCRDVVRRRASGEPVAYILQRRDFYGHTFYVDPHVLIPRPETELLVETAESFLKSMSSPRLLDLGTGSGCIAISLLKSLPQAQAVLVDVSDGALQIARKNAHALEVEGRCEFRLWNASETLTPDTSDFQLIVANPPYISPQDPDIESNVKKFEPSLALFAEDNGLEMIRSWAKAQVQYLQSGGLMIFEMGAHQGPSVRQIFSEMKVFSEIQILKDLAGHERTVVAKKE